MKCLSINQPFAELIVIGRKTIELRKTNAPFTGKTILIHASKTESEEENRFCKEDDIDLSSLARGDIIGSAILYQTKLYQSKDEVLTPKMLAHAEDSFNDI